MNENTVVFFSSISHCCPPSDVPLAFPFMGNGERAPNLDLTGFLKRCLVCADLHHFFFPIIFPPGATAGSRGCHGDQWPAWRVIRRLYSLWFLAQTYSSKSLDMPADKWWQQLPAWLILYSLLLCNSAGTIWYYSCQDWNFDSHWGHQH